MRNDDIAAVLDLINRLGLTVADLTNHIHHQQATPTFGEYIRVVRAAVSPTTAANYNTYWRLIEHHWSHRRIDQPTSTEIGQLVQQHRDHVVIRTNSRDGHAAIAHFVSAFRCLYAHAERDRLIDPRDNPAAAVPRPVPLPGKRHALTVEQILELAHIAATTGDDPALDALIVRLHIETACRRAAVLSLTLPDLNVPDCLIKLREKGTTVRWHPVSPTLMRRLIHHAAERGGSETTNHVLRYRTGRPLGRRRYDTLTTRLRDQLPWAAALGVSAHWIRHTTLTWVEREFGMAIARAFAGHSDRPSRATTTFTYVTASVTELAHAVAALTGEPHPLARNPHRQ
ncbi:tyrosine-type recombinase/integrase [Nocardia farcinica]|uniref:tyrosine-type recombinase/integrase n=1 Tax=Nocardia farcinica TaxID=37329 RepID=UPI000A37790E|nr:site-specific integrase [Nocardia farcinica]MBA4857466.1 tyrosine-type recombinase/integrase [Nocardia farcinica]MBC9816235.1 tyrosine-type recombinase/integrase [Nocardia farcinica]MBF6068503.1 tyrosine-type recombinase/integrase [Nocardia farcinica]MBF6250230.1 tyrosine-type recombinase/integrase [Nocardia farcinica]MBF6262362.1 tyrosine-type recombinase/integrase [Nocardia farcinica]